MNKQTLSGPIASRNKGEEFIRVDEIAESTGPFLNRKTGFYPIKEGGYAEALKLIEEGKVSLKLGSQTRNGVFNVSLIDETAATPVGAAANATVTLEHTA